MKNILIVDDSSTVRQQVSLALQQVGFRVLEAADGRAAVTALDKVEIALVICDVNMPGMNGLEMLEQIQRDRRHTHIPVLMLTTESSKAVVDRAKSAGAKAWIVKPFKADLMVAAVQKILSRES
jgi:two-component system chemotaxis response regulator CheY